MLAPFPMRTCKGSVTIHKARYELGRTPKYGLYKAYLLAENVNTRDPLWAEAGPGSARSGEPKLRWDEYDVKKQPHYGWSDPEEARKYVRHLLSLAPFMTLARLHHGLQPNNRPEMVGEVLYPPKVSGAVSESA